MAFVLFYFFAVFVGSTFSLYHEWGNSISNFRLLYFQHVHISKFFCFHFLSLCICYLVGTSWIPFETLWAPTWNLWAPTWNVRACICNPCDSALDPRGSHLDPRVFHLDPGGFHLQPQGFHVDTCWLPCVCCGIAFGPSGLTYSPMCSLGLVMINQVKLCGPQHIHFFYNKSKMKFDIFGLL